jgi:hypothetical protein
MKPLTELLDYIVKNNIKLPATIWFKHQAGDEKTHLGEITEVRPSNITICYYQTVTGGNPIKRTMYMYPKHTHIIAELDETDYSMLGGM